MDLDPLSDTLSLIEARCVVSGGFTAGGSWGLRFWPQARLKLVAVAQGSCWLTGGGAVEPVLLQPGDAAVVNGWHEVLLGHDPGAEHLDMTEEFTASQSSVLSLSQDRSVAVVGGHIEVNGAGEDLLLAVLPPITRISAEVQEAQSINWLLRRLLQEMTGDLPGASLAVRQHAQSLLVEVFRAYLADTDALPVGWLRVIADERLGPVLRALHAEPGRAWSLEELAQVASMSRTTFVDRFRAAAGVPPMTYLQQWRLRLAQRELRTTDTPISRLAPALGYGSESAFSNAFKRATGLSPRHYRNAQRSEATPETRPATTGAAP